MASEMTLYYNDKIYSQFHIIFVWHLAHFLIVQERTFILNFENYDLDYFYRNCSH